MKDKPSKWGYKYWVLANILGYTVDFNLYCGAARTESYDHGLANVVIMELVEPFRFQGYQIFCNNFYSSPKLFTNLLEDEISATGTIQWRGAQKKVATATKWRRRDILRIEIAGKTGKWDDAKLF